MFAALQSAGATGAGAAIGSALGAAGGAVGGVIASGLKSKVHPYLMKAKELQQQDWPRQLVQPEQESSVERPRSHLPRAPH
jgi:hypothetical protein